MRFIEGEINPLDVKPGDTQKMRVVVSSPYGIKEVRAEIQTDHAKKVIPLKKTGVVSWRDLTPPRYRVDENGTLRILSEKEIAENYARLVALDAQNSSATGKVAQAVENDTAEKEIWTGSWVVEDTHETTYRTVFIATDNKSNSAQLTLAWSDPCTDLSNQVSGDYTLASSCSIGSTDGIAAGNLTGAGGTCGPGQAQCTLTINADFAFYPGYHITLDSNYKISIGTGAIKQTYLWVTDGDGDKYPPTGFTKVAQDTSPAGYTKQDLLSSLTATDCNDSYFNVNPGQTGWFTSPRTDTGTYDYNCSSVEEKQYTNYNFDDYCSFDIKNGCYNNPTGNYIGSGWSGSVVPSCGGSGTLGTGPSSYLNCAVYGSDVNACYAVTSWVTTSQGCH